MQVADYGRSYIFFTTKGQTNTARLQVEARLQVTDAATGRAEEYFLFASCKAEHTHVSDHLFQDPNYDFCGAFGEHDFVLFRTPAWHDVDRNSHGPIAATFDSARQVIRWEAARPLATRAAIVDATLSGTPLIGQTAWEDHAAGVRVLIEYPVKTMNVHPERGAYQIDTGPLPFPDLSRASARPVEHLVPAYVAWNRDDRAEFILQRPTPVLQEGREVCHVLHYSEIRRMAVTNALFAAGPEHEDVAPR